MMKLSSQEICKLEKGAYGLVDAPYMWFQAILEELLHLGFEQSPFDPCLFTLRNPQNQQLDGILGLHVDDGLCAGNQHFHDKLQLLEKKYPFGTKRVGQFTFTGIEMNQTPEGTIHLSQSKYIRTIEPIKLSPERPQTERFTCHGGRKAAAASSHWKPTVCISTYQTRLIQPA